MADSNSTETYKYTGEGNILIQDTIISAICSLFAILFMRWITEPMFGFTGMVIAWVLVGAAATVVGILFVGSHKVVRRYMTARSFDSFFKVTFVKVAILAVVFFIFRFKMTSSDIWITLVVDALLTVATFVLTRVAIVAHMENIKENPDMNIGNMNTLIAGVDMDSVANATMLDTMNHYNVMGFITTDKRMEGKIVQDKKVYCCNSGQDLEALAWSLGGIDRVSFTSAASNSMKDLLDICLENGVAIIVSPEPKKIENKVVDQAQSDDAGMELSIPDGMTKVGSWVKRAIDFVGSAAIMLVFSPLFLFCYIAVKREDGGPAIYSQERIGHWGKPFLIYKFRTMKMNAEEYGPQLYSGEDDPRLTKIGRFLRAHHLDELPQLWNVFIGDMSFIGYRPERKFYIDKIMERDARYKYLYQIRPGVTSYATLYNGYTDTIEKMLKRLEYDLYYLRHRSLLFDAKVLWMTFTSIVFGKKF